MHFGFGSSSRVLKFIAIGLKDIDVSFDFVQLVPSKLKFSSRAISISVRSEEISSPRIAATLEKHFENLGTVDLCFSTQISL